jgi:hypothetical protein
MQMTHEDEEFNRIEMESRIRQESVRATRDANQARPQNCGTSYCSCIECVMEQEQGEPVAWDLKDVTDAYKLGAKSQQRTWVELTEQELVELRARVQEYTPIDSVKYGEAIQRAMNNALKEKNA